MKTQPREYEIEVEEDAPEVMPSPVTTPFEPAITPEPNENPFSPSIYPETTPKG